MKKQKLTIIVLASFLFLTSQYILFEKWNEFNQQEKEEFYQLGYDRGLADAVAALYEQTENCNISNITFGNLTKGVLDITCLESNLEKNP